ncbi:MAG TPA: hypothetical protein IAB87_05785 [Candidatus Coprenecus merdipullorum]|nr:hypothetical protein [Candidatus Coprenecus merdipullorum]
MKKIFVIISIVLLSIMAMPCTDAASPEQQSDGYVNVTFVLSCTTENRSVLYNDIITNPDILMEIYDYLDLVLCGNDDHGISPGGGIFIEQDEVDGNTTRPANP